MDTRKPGPPTSWQTPITRTHAWVVDSSTSSLPSKQAQYRKEGRATEEWVGQRSNGRFYVEVSMDISEPPLLPSRPHRNDHARPHRSGTTTRCDLPTTPRTAANWDERMYQWELEAERWMRHEERHRRMAEESFRSRSRLDEELRRVDERVRRARHEHCRMADEARARAMAAAELREHEHQFRSRLEKGVAESWEKYESRWSELASSTETLTFANIPWPTASAPRAVEELTASAISAFLLSGAHSPDKPRKDRIRSAQLRWHPDRFRRLMGRVADDDKAAVEQGVGAVATVLNDLMKREKGSSR